MKARKEEGEAVDSKNIKKHKNDIFRLLANVSPTSNVDLPDSVGNDVVNFIEMKKEAMKRCLCGALGGLILSNAIMLFHTLTQGELVLDFKRLSIHLMLYILIGVQGALSSVIYNIENWSLLRQTVSHFLIIGVWIPLANLVGWLDGSLKQNMIATTVFVLFYLVQWIVMYTYWKNQANKINEKMMERSV